MSQLEVLVAWLKNNPDGPDGYETSDGVYRKVPTVTPATIYAGAGVIGYLIDDATATHYYALSYAENDQDASVATMLAVLLLRQGRRSDARRVIEHLIVLRRIALDRAKADFDKYRGPGPLETWALAERDLKAAEQLLAEASYGVQAVVD